MKDKFKYAYMDVAERFAELSTARRLKVGCIIVKNDRIISIGYNGMPSGWDNRCEDDIPVPSVGLEYRFETKTRPEVLHAETNAIAKVARSVESCVGSTVFVTHEPCLECAKLMYQSHIHEVYFRNNYISSNHGSGIYFLKQAGIIVERL